MSVCVSRSYIIIIFTFSKFSFFRLSFTLDNVLSISLKIKRYHIIWMRNWKIKCFTNMSNVRITYRCTCKIDRSQIDSTCIYTHANYEHWKCITIFVLLCSVKSIAITYAHFTDNSRCLNVQLLVLLLCTRTTPKYIRYVL